ncbi:MAG: DUF5666 domain-containing protein [Firmicutes bacterium]|nr:DUF5666 domain-containing protein [Bacillota bacterium]
MQSIFRHIFTSSCVRILKHLFCAVIFVLSSSLGVFAGEKGFASKITGIDLSGKVIYVTTGKQKKEVRFNDGTKFFRKSRPLPADFKSKPGEFRKNDIIYVFTDNPSSVTPVAKEIWEDRAFAVKNNLVQTEKLITGEVLSVKAASGILSLRTFDQKNQQLKISETTGVFFDNFPGHIVDLRPGTKVAVSCRWPGYEEDRPETPSAVEVMNSGTFVIRKFRERFGPLLGRGKVSGIDMSLKTIKISTGQGVTATVGFSGLTRWIPATPRIKTPADFNGYEVLIFGEERREKRSEARMVLNVIGINTIFQDIVNEGDIKGAVTILAFGDVVSIDNQSLVVFSREKKVTIKILKNTLFVKKGRKVALSQIEKGDRVLVEGIFDNPPVALRITDFGKISK